MKIGVFFTFKMSLAGWNALGILEREIALYKSLSHEGCDITFFTYGDESDYEFCEQLGKIKVVAMYAGGRKPKTQIETYLKSLILPFQLKKYFRGPDIYKTNQMWGSWVPLIAKILYRKKMIVRSGYEIFRFGRLTKMPLVFQVSTYFNSLLSYWLADKVVITADFGKKFIEKFFKIPSAKIIVQPNYVDIEKFRPLNRDVYPDRLLFVGRLESEKNLYNLLEAVSATPFGLDIVGRGPMAVELADYIKKNGIKARLLGGVTNDQLPEIYNQYSAYILPSTCEGMPKTLLEAMSTGRAVIGSDREGINNIIIHGVNGFLCNVDSFSIQKAITAVMADPQLCQRLGTAARAYIVEKHSLPKVLEQERDIYTKTMGTDFFERKKNAKIFFRKRDGGRN